MRTQTTAEIITRCQALYEDNYFTAAREWKEAKEGRKVIGYMPVYIPREIIHAAGMLPVRHGPDHLALKALANERDIADAASAPDQVRLLWEVCQIPDFRRQAGAQHARFLASVFRHLAGDRKPGTSGCADTRLSVYTGIACRGGGLLHHAQGFQPDHYL